MHSQIEALNVYMIAKIKGTSKIMFALLVPSLPHYYSTSVFHQQWRHLSRVSSRSIIAPSLLMCYWAWVQIVIDRSNFTFTSCRIKLYLEWLPLWFSVQSRPILISHFKSVVVWYAVRLLLARDSPKVSQIEHGIMCTTIF